MDQRSQWHMQISAIIVKKSNILAGLRVERKWIKINKKSTGEFQREECHVLALEIYWPWAVNEWRRRGREEKNSHNEENGNEREMKKREVLYLQRLSWVLTHLWLAMRFKNEANLHGVFPLSFVLCNDDKCETLYREFVNLSCLLSQETNKSSLNIFSANIFQINNSWKIKCDSLKHFITFH